MRRRRPVKNEELMPSWRRNLVVGRGGDLASVARAREFGEKDASAHDITMCTRRGLQSLREASIPLARLETLTCDERNAHRRRCTLKELDGNCISTAVCPVGILNGIFRLRKALVEVRWDIHFDSEFFWELGGAVVEEGLGITTRYQYATIGKQLVIRASAYTTATFRGETHGGLRVVQTGNNSGVQDGDARMDRLRWVIQECRQVGEVRKSKACNTLLGTVHDQEGTIRES